MIGGGIFRDLALRVVEEGFPVFPLKEGSKQPMEMGGFHNATTDVEQIRKWIDQYPNANVGVPTGEVSGISVVDVDGEEGIASMREHFPNSLPPTRTHKTPRGGYHMIYQHDPLFRNLNGALNHVDIKTDGGYIVWQGSEFEGKHYAILRDVPIASIGYVPEPFRKGTRKNQDQKNTTETIQGIINGVPEGSRDQRAFDLVDKLFRIGSSEETVTTILHYFADNCSPPLEHSVADEKIRRMRGEYDYPEPSIVNEATDPIEDAYRRMHFTHPTEWLNEAEIEETFVVEDLIPSGALVMVTSFPKAGKSTFTRNLSMAVARGEDFLGRKVQQGKVLYLALEEQSNKVKRSFRRMGLEADDPLQIKFGKPSREAVDDLRVIVQQEKPVMVVIDTVTRMPKGKFEMNDYFSNSEWLDPYMYMAHDLGVAILVNYHSSRNGRGLEGVDAIAAPIGSTGILATPDQIINIKVEADHTRNISSMGRFEPFPPTLVDFDRETELLVVIGEKSGITHRKIRQDIIENCSDTSWKNQKDVLHEVEGKASDKQKALAELLEEKLVHRQGEGKRGSPYEIRTGEFLFPLPTIEIEKGNETFTPIKMERLEFDI